MSDRAGSRSNSNRSSELANYHQDPRSNARRANGPAIEGSNGVNQQSAPHVMSAGGKADGLSFDHVLHKLQVSISRPLGSSTDFTRPSCRRAARQDRSSKD